jgi:hypothetical protein
MKFLSQMSPKLTLTRTKRKCIIDEVSNLITLHESTIKIEISMPSILQGMKDQFYNLVGILFVPRVCAV